MKAITYSRYGPPEVLELAEVEKPRPGKKDILIRVRAAEATKSDCELRSFRFSVHWFSLPLRLAVGVFRPRRRILGGYFAGVVAEVGADVSGLAPGDEVFGGAGLQMGAYGEFMVLPAGASVAAKPANMTFEEAAAVPLGGLNPLHFLTLAEIRSGEQVLINGAGGSIGAHGVQIAKAMGAEVWAVDKAEKKDFIMRMGADHFIDYQTRDFTRLGLIWDVIFDMVPHGSYSKRIKALGPGGRYLTGNPRFSVMLRSPFTNRFSDKSASFAFARETREELDTLREMIDAGSITSIVDRVLPMEQAAAAHRLVETEERLGAIVIDMGQS